MRTEPMTHDLKILPEYFAEVFKDKKTAEIRFDDRDFRIGDTMVLREWKPRKKEYTGRKIIVKITGITRLARVIEGVDFNWLVLYFNKENIWYQSLTRRTHDNQHTAR